MAEINLKKCELLEILKLVDGKLMIKSLPSNSTIEPIDCTWDDCDEFAANVVIGVGPEEYYVCMPCEKHMGMLRQFHKEGVPLEGKKA